MRTVLRAQVELLERKIEMRDSTGEDATSCSTLFDYIAPRLALLSLDNHVTGEHFAMNSLFFRGGLETPSSSVQERRQAETKARSTCGDFAFA